MFKKITKAVIPVAGLGTRFLPITKSIPKEMLPIVEKPNIDNAPSNYAGLGRYIISPKVFSVLENLDKGVGNEIQITDAMNKMMKTEKFYACQLDAEYYDTGSKLGYLKANIDFAKDRDEFKESLTNYFNN